MEKILKTDGAPDVDLVSSARRVVRAATGTCSQTTREEDIDEEAHCEEELTCRCRGMNPPKTYRAPYKKTTSPAVLTSTPLLHTPKQKAVTRTVTATQHQRV